MTQVHSIRRLTAAPASPQGVRLETPDPLQLHTDAHNALAMALHYLRQLAANVPGATRKAVQALAALRLLKAVPPSATEV